MKLLCVMILSIVSATNLLADDETKQSDPYFKKTIVGTWQIQNNAYGVDVHVVDTYLSNGKMDRKTTVRNSNGVIQTGTARISWNIKNAVLIHKIESIMTIPMEQIGPPGQYKIISMDKDTFHLTDNYGRGKAGKVLLFHRVKSQSGKGDI